MNPIAIKEQDRKVMSVYGTRSLWARRILFATAIFASTGGLLRQLWAWPDAVWQTHLLYLPDIDFLLSGRFDRVIWFDLGNLYSGHSLNGHRLFSYLNAYVFGLNSRVELIVYWTIVLVTSLAFVLLIIKSNLEFWPRGVASALLVIMVMTNLSGAGAAGMEIGTYFGQTLLLGLVFLASGEFKLGRFLAIVIPTIPFVLFFFLGGYLAGWAVGLSLMLGVLVLRRKTGLVSQITYRKFLVLASLSSFWSVVFYLLIPKIQTTGSFFEMWQIDYFFPIKYLIFGFASPIFTTQSFESFPSLVAFFVPLATGLVLLILTVATFVKSLSQSGTLVTVGQSLVLFGLGTALVLLGTRPWGDQWLLSSWYSFNFKLSLSGSVLLGFSSIIDKNLNRTLATYGLVAALIVSAYSLALARGPHEREYWLDIQKATYYPELLQDRGDGYTQLIADLETSLASVEILRKHNLGVFRPGAVNLEDLK